jgi:hypothetical protein
MRRSPDTRAGFVTSDSLAIQRHLVDRRYPHRLEKDAFIQSTAFSSFVQKLHTLSVYNLFTPFLFS